MDLLIHVQTPVKPIHRVTKTEHGRSVTTIELPEICQFSGKAEKLFESVERHT